MARFVPLSPSHLLSEVKRKKELAESIIEQIELLGRGGEQEQSIIVYESVEDLARAEIKLYDLMQPGETQYILGLSPAWFDLLGDAQVAEFARIQKEKQFFIKGLASVLNDKERDYAKDTSELTEFRVLPGVASTDTEINILYDRILIKVFVAPYTSVEIINPKLAQDYRRYFEQLWKQEVVIYRGWDEIEKLYFNELLEDIQSGDTEYIFGANLGESVRGRSRAIDFFTRFNVARREKGGRLQALFFEKDQQHIQQQFVDSGDIEAGAVEIKYLQDKYWSPLGVDIFPNKAVILMMEEEPSATVYDNPDVIAGFKKQFDARWEQEVQTYVGWDQIRHLMFEKIFPSFSGKTEYAQGTGYDIAVDTAEFERFWLEYNTRRIQLGITRHVMMYEPYREQLNQEIADAGDPEHQLTHMRFLPKEYNSPMEIHIYGDIVVLIAWQGIPTATVYNRKEMSESFKNQFDMLWGIAKE